MCILLQVKPIGRKYEKDFDTYWNTRFYKFIDNHNK